MSALRNKGYQSLLSVSTFFMENDDSFLECRRRPVLVCIHLMFKWLYILLRCVSLPVEIPLVAARSWCSAHLVNAPRGKHDGGECQEAVALQKHAGDARRAARGQDLRVGQAGLEHCLGLWKEGLVTMATCFPASLCAGQIKCFSPTFQVPGDLLHLHHHLKPGVALIQAGICQGRTVFWSQAKERAILGIRRSAQEQYTKPTRRGGPHR